MLKVEKISTFYGSSQALCDVSLHIGKGQCITLLGRNGMGKSTTVKSIMGIVPPSEGKIFIDGRETQTLPSYSIARLGMGLVPEGRQVFPNLTVYENIVVAAANWRKKENPYTFEEMIEIFPRLGDRLDHYGNQLSGGEQQMLAVVRALMTNPKMLIMDEATEGLAPLMREEIWMGMEILKSKGLAILLIDKNIKALIELADRHYVMEKGRVVWSGNRSEIEDNKELQMRYLGV